MPPVMEDRGSMNDTLISSRILVVCDANGNPGKYELSHTIRNIRMRGGIVNSGDTITVIGVLSKILHPMGYQMGVSSENILGTTPIRVDGEVSKKADLYVSMLQDSVGECERVGVDIEVKIIAGNSIKKVVIQEVATSNPTWVILDRPLRKELKHYLKHIPCKVALVQDNLTLGIMRCHSIEKETTAVEDRQFYSLSKSVSLPPLYESDNNEQSMRNNASLSSFENSDMSKTSFGSSSFASSFLSQDEYGFNLRQENSGNCAKGGFKNYVSTPVLAKNRRKATKQRSSDVPVLCVSCGLTTEMDSTKYCYSEINAATNNFAAENLLGEGGYGLVYRGELKNGQQIAAKVRKEESTQGYLEFYSEVYVLTFARHKNIVMLLGFYCKENLSILVYEYICNKSLYWHLFDNTDYVLEWHRRYAIAVGTAKGLRFLHEECRGSPIIHRDMRPSNILLTHDFVPMLGDFGLAKWKTDNEDTQSMIAGTLGYLAPEYAENGIVSVRTDVYAYGIVLIQLISGCKVVDYTKENHDQSLRQWALPLIETLALHKLVDPKLRDYNMSEMYHMARTAYLCIQTDPEKRPSMPEVLRLLEGEGDCFNYLTEQFIPHYTR